MTNNRLPFIGSGRPQEGGVLAVRKSDFNVHVSGGGFRHDATNIDMNPVISLVGGITVQETLEKLHSLIISAGTGFLSIGSVDGYVQGDYNVGEGTTLTLHDTFIAAFADVRLQNGGIILVLAGTYHLQTSVLVPGGISIVGEISGTTIIGEMQEAPMFIIQKPNNGIDLVAGVSLDTGSNVDSVKIMNLILADNLDGYVLFGEPSMTTVPMIQAQVSSNLTCENVSFIGRIHTGSLPRTKTQSAVGYTGSDVNGTTLKLKNCYLDGLRIGVSFVPNNNTADFLTIENCKARIFGTEDVAVQSISLNSFIVMSHCNAVVVNNYFIGQGSYVNTFIDIISGDGINTKIILNGNTGAPKTTANGQLINDETGGNFTSIVTGNVWGSFNIDSAWYIVVGNGAGTSTLGDFNGQGAVDTVLSIAKNIPAFAAIVIVNPGTYSITGNGVNNTYANLSFIGNKHGSAYPIFNFNLGTFVVDNLGNAPIGLGNKLQSIQFVSTHNKHSVRPGFNTASANTQTSAHLLEVIDCIFINTALYVLDLGAKPWLDEAFRLARTEISVKDCYFLQTGTFQDTISCVLPLADQVCVENCIFKGNGYALSIGHNGYVKTNSNLTTSNASVKNSTFDLTGYTISTQNIFEKSYVFINDPAVLNMENCQIYADNQYDNASPISNTLTGSLTQPFDKFVYFRALNINIDDCIFVGPAQTFISSAITYGMTTLFVEPQYSARIRNSRFSSGACLLQIGNTAMSDGLLREDFIVENCHFNSEYFTLIDYDLALQNEDAFTHFVIDKCSFANGVIDAKPFHTNSTDTVRCGAVQLFVGDSFVEFTNNLMKININAISNRILAAALMINAYDNLSTAGDQINPIKVNNNTIYSSNNFTSADSNAGSASILLRSSSVNIQNNLFSQYNGSVVSSSFIGCLIIDNQASLVGLDSRGIVTGNIFTRKNYLGTSSNLARGYIQIYPGSSTINGGLISNNIFDSTTYNGISNILVEDNTQNPSNNINYSNWIITQNQNQSRLQKITWATGEKGIATGADLNKAILYGGVVSPSSITANLSSPEYVVFNYTHTGSQDQFRWNICLSEIIPPDVTITQINYRYQASAVPTTTKVITATLSGADGDISDSNTIVDTNVHNRSIIPSLNYTTKNTDNVYLHIQTNINHSSSLTVSIFEIFIAYHW